jgi:hypothetical protein
LLSCGRHQGQGEKGNLFVFGSGLSANILCALHHVQLFSCPLTISLPPPAILNARSSKNRRKAVSSNFVDFLIDSNVEPAEATALGSSCVSKGQYLSLIIDYSAAENVDALFGEESTPINYKPFLRDAEIDGNNPANHRQDYWDSPAMIEGEPMSWNQMYESFIQPEGEPPLEMGKVIQDSVKRDSLNFVRDLYPERAAEGA